MSGYTSAVLLLLALSSVSCATTRDLMGPVWLNKGTIEVYRDAKKECRTNTTLFFSVKKDRERVAEWKIEGDQSCLKTLDVELKFDKGQGDPFPTCDKKGKRKIECDLRPVTSEGVFGYSVWLGSATEDPEIQIEM